MKEYRTIDGSYQRLESRSGHVVTVGPEFKKIPEVLEGQALARRCVTREMYEGIKKEVQQTEGNSQGDEVTSPFTSDGNPVQDEESQKQERDANIKDALAGLKEAVGNGVTEYEGHNLLTTQNKPSTEALSAMVGFKVSRADIDRLDS